MPERSVKPFPMQESRSGAWTFPKHTIPEYLAQYAYARLTRMQNAVPPLEFIAAQGGFTPMMLLDLLAGGNGAKPYAAISALVSYSSRSILGEVQIVTEGSKAYKEAVREFESEMKEKARNRGRMVFGSAGVFGDGQAVKRGNMWNGRGGDQRIDPDWATKAAQAGWTR